MAETRRGRKSQSSYRAMVSRALGYLDDLCTLNEFPVLCQLPTIERWAASHPHDLLPHGKALRGYLRKAVAEVITCIGEGGTSSRVVEYIQLRYQQGVLVKDIAERWHLSVEQVWRSAGRQAVELITEQFLQIARCSEQKSKLVQVVSKLDQ